MASNSRRRSVSSGRSKARKRVVITAQETVRVRDPLKDGKGAQGAKRPARSGATREKAVPAQVRSTQGGVLAGSKKHERERRQRVIRLRRVAVGLLALLLFAGLVAGVRALYRAPVLKIESVKVTGARHLNRSQVLAIADVSDDATMLRLGGSAIERRLERNPWIASAEVRRDFPHTLRITVRERTPVVAVDLGGTDVWLVSEDAHWLGRIGSTESSSVLSVREVEQAEPKAGGSVKSDVVLNAIDVATGLSAELRDRVREIVAPSIEKTELITRDDIEIFVGESTDMQTKDRIIREILEQQKGRVVYINVRVVESPTWRGLEDPAE